MFVPCVIRRSRNNQLYALICTTPLFYVLAATCFGSSLPSSGSFLDPSGLPEIQIEWVVYHIMNHDRTMTVQHTGHVTTHYIIYYPLDFITSNSAGSKKLPDDGRLLPKHVGTSLWIKECYNQWILLVISASLIWTVRTLNQFSPGIRKSRKDEIGSFSHLFMKVVGETWLMKEYFFKIKPCNYFQCFFST
jgi:hypothetical protein